MYIEKIIPRNYPKIAINTEGNLYNLNLLYNNNNNNNNNNKNKNKKIHFVFRCKIYSNSHYKLRAMILYKQKRHWRTCVYVRQ